MTSKSAMTRLLCFLLLCSHHSCRRVSRLFVDDDYDMEQLPLAKLMTGFLISYSELLEHNVINNAIRGSTEVLSQRYEKQRDAYIDMIPLCTDLCVQTLQRTADDTIKQPLLDIWQEAVGAGWNHVKTDLAKKKLKLKPEKMPSQFEYAEELGKKGTILDDRQKKGLNELRAKMSQKMFDRTMYILNNKVDEELLKNKQKIWRKISKRLQKSMPYFNGEKTESMLKKLFHFLWKLLDKYARICTNLLKEGLAHDWA
eukprot:CAMPEP_0202710276 /NCGR_PEP_ID=MMETSP1385-20130828/22285_1 /ASSEMBLY_ACC=CAM_ASM_000861 /TAXON_ID=933848 /ORGANISM="Elphidium margaritaceum" /LENGTH=255 /DNA_ID=CAMNT_0049369777 /DNA_START=19 /DNA_END=783 /DNA_ORIENTATION=-